MQFYRVMWKGVSRLIIVRVTTEGTGSSLSINVVKTSGDAVAHLGNFLLQEQVAVLACVQGARNLLLLPHPPLARPRMHI
jgi:hypothetical protein